MHGVRNLIETLIQRWTAILEREESRWRETLRAEGGQGADVDDPAPDSESKNCAAKPETPSLLDEAARRRGQVRHRNGK